MLVTVYKAKNGHLPEYLHNLFPNTVAEISNYPLRNGEDYITLPRRTQIFANSFIPSSTALWNTLDSDIRNAQSIQVFKSKLKNIYKPPDVPKYYLTGKRILSVYHARLRNKCSNLNDDLYRNHIRDTPTCDCGYETENAEHYIFNCKLYINQRIQLFRNTRPYHPLSTNKLLYGNELYSDEENAYIFAEVQNFIKNTNRFNLPIP